MNKIQKFSLIFFSGLLFLFFGLGERGFSLRAKGKPVSVKARVFQIEDQSLSDRLRVLIKASGPISHHSFTLTGPNRLVIDLKPCILAKDRSFKIKDPLIERLRFSQFNPETVRIVLELSHPPIYHISPKPGDPFLLLVDFPLSSKSARIPSPPLPAASREELKPETLNEFKQEQESSLKPTVIPPKDLVSFDFYNADIHNVLRAISDVAKVDIVAGDEIKGRVTLSIKNMPWDQALDLILSTLKLIKVPQGKAIRISTMKDLIETEAMKRKEEREASRMEQEMQKAEQDLLKTDEELRKTKEARLPLMTKQFKLNYVPVKILKEMIDDIFKKDPTKKGSPSFVESTNTLFVRATRPDLDYIEKLVQAADQPTPQVMIEARIVEANTNFTRDLGLRWGGSYAFANANAPYAGTIRGGEAGQPGSNYAVNLPLASTSTAFGGLGFAFSSTNLNLDVRLQAMEQEGKGKTLSSPKVMTLDNKEAIIKQGSKIPVTSRDQNNAFSTTYIDAALILKTTPHISSNRKKISLSLKIEKNEPDFSHVDSVGNPVINIKEAQTEMMINDGETIVIGGIIVKQEQVQDNRVPGLASIPFLGWLFKTQFRNTQNTELLIFITPRIIQPGFDKSAPGI